MKRDFVDFSFTEHVRALQAIHSEAHEALLNWGRWSRDLKRVFPPGIPESPTFREATPSKFGDFADDSDLLRVEVVAQTETKAERSEEEPYDERSGALLDERIHGYGGLPIFIREVLKAAYVSREVPEEQFHRMAGCSRDAFRERLEAGLIFVRRFV